MDENVMQALRLGLYNERIADISSKTEMNVVIQDAGIRFIILTFLIFFIFFISSMEVLSACGFKTKKGGAAYILTGVALCVFTFLSVQGTKLAWKMPENDLYALTINPDEKEKIKLTDGLYALAEISEDDAGYLVSVPKALPHVPFTLGPTEELLLEYFPKESYHFEKVIDVETDTLADLHKVVN